VHKRVRRIHSNVAVAHLGFLRWDETKTVPNRIGVSVRNK
jgi:hypothetical protein